MSLRAVKLYDLLNSISDNRLQMDNHRIYGLTVIQGDSPSSGLLETPTLTPHTQCLPTGTSTLFRVTPSFQRLYFVFEGTESKRSSTDSRVE